MSKLNVDRSVDGLLEYAGAEDIGVNANAILPSGPYFLGLPLFFFTGSLMLNPEGLMPEDASPWYEGLKESVGLKPGGTMELNGSRMVGTIPAEVGLTAELFVMLEP